MICELIPCKLNNNLSRLGAGDGFDFLELVEGLNRLTCVFQVNLFGLEIHINGEIRINLLPVCLGLGVTWAFGWVFCGIISTVHNRE